MPFEKPPRTAESAADADKEAKQLMEDEEKTRQAAEGSQGEAPEITEGDVDDLFEGLGK